VTHLGRSLDCPDDSGLSEGMPIHSLTLRDDAALVAVLTVIQAFST
jgi:hypothetical protein